MALGGCDCVLSCTGMAVGSALVPTELFTAAFAASVSVSMAEMCCLSFWNSWKSEEMISL